MKAITKAKTVEELDRLCTRFTDTLEEDLKKRLYVYSEKGSSWSACKSLLSLEPKIKKIYKYHVKPAEANTNPHAMRKPKIKSHKKNA